MTGGGGQVTDTDRHGDQWVTIPQAAEILGKSTRTVRRYVADGKLEADKDRTPMMVNVSDIDRQVTDTGGQVADSDRQRVHELEAALERAEAEAQGLRSKVDRLALENRELDARNELLERLLDQVGEERDYLRQANAAALSKIPDQKPGLWRRLLPWRGGEND